MNLFCLLVCIASGAAWLVSYWWPSHVTVKAIGSVIGVAVKPGYLDLEYCGVDGRGDHRHSRVYITADENPWIAPPFCSPDDWHVAASFNHQIGVDDESFLKQLIGPAAFFEQRIENSYFRRWRSGFVFLVEIPFLVLVLAFGYLPVICGLRMLRSRVEGM